VRSHVVSNLRLPGADIKNFYWTCSFHRFRTNNNNSFIT